MPKFPSHQSSPAIVSISTFRSRASRREERAARAAAVAERMHQGYLARCVGKTFPVLFEQDRGEGSVGHAPNYMPVTVGMKGLHNTVQNVRITAVDGDGLRGEPEET